VGGCCLTNEINEFFIAQGEGGREMGKLRESVIREHVLSHITPKAFLFMIYIPSITSKKWQKDVSDGNVKTHLVKKIN
jgi:hypothetical protein